MYDARTISVEAVNAMMRWNSDEASVYLGRKVRDTYRNDGYRISDAVEGT